MTTANEATAEWAGRLAKLESDIRAKRNSVGNAIVNRREHPTYGYTKRDLLAQFNELCGMLKAWLVMSGWWTGNAGVIFLAEMKTVIRQEFGITLDNLAQQVKES